jgi:hypothetical protein
MKWIVVAGKVIQAWNQAATSRPDLFADNASEDTFRGRLVGDLVQSFHGDGFEIDQNFNVMNYPDGTRNPKRILISGSNDLVRPDIVIHHPGADEFDHNLLAIELKKWFNPDWEEDIVKLRELTRKPAGIRSFQYQYGLPIRYRQTSEIGAAFLCRNGSDTPLNPQNLQGKG